MKVIESIESIYLDQKILNEKLEIRVKEKMSLLKKNSWFFFGRIKQLESFALKLETGRFSNAKALEDFFACTLVVENLSQIKFAIDLIGKEFRIVNRRPKDLAVTHKLPYSFEFDDLRLYAKLKKTPHLESDPISEIEFEIQIKTFLQHAWGIATHDLIYKSDTISWPKQRIAYQIKAMLEQAEVVISGVNTITGVPEVDKASTKTIKQNKILSFYIKYYKKEDLPKDLVTLCNNTLDLLIAMNLNIEQLELMIKRENALGRGTKLKNLSPYLLIIQSILNQNSSLFEKFINNPEDNKFKIIIPKEINLGIIKLGNEKNVIRI